jgi:uncharacterized SAM-binding protein YcdF (DUF218 family)
VLVLVALILLWSWPPVAAVVSTALERWYPPLAGPLSGVDAIVVLSGNVRFPRPAHPVAFPGDHTLLRCRYAAWLASQNPGLPVIVTGGDTGGINMAALMAADLESQGVPRDRLVLEGAAQSTAENSQFVARILRERGWRRVAVVTEGYHMPRAMLWFRRSGVDAIAAPCGLRGQEFSGELGDWLPDFGAARENAESLHELGGLAWFVLSSLR